MLTEGEISANETYIIDLLNEIKRERIRDYVQIENSDFGFVEILSKSASRGWKQTSKKTLCYSVQINGN
jgi:phage anti-repressor protein